MMETQSLMKSLFTHISMSVAGCNLSTISRLLSLLTIQIPSSPFPSSSRVSLCSAPPPPAPVSSCASYFCSVFSRLLLPSPLPSLSFSQCVFFNYSSLHPWRSEGTRVCWGLRGTWAVDGWQGEEKGTGEGDGGGWGVGACRRIIKHRFGTMLKTATRRQTRGLWVRQPTAFCWAPQISRRGEEREAERGRDGGREGETAS